MSSIQCLFSLLCFVLALHGQIQVTTSTTRVHGHVGENRITTRRRLYTGTHTGAHRGEKYDTADLITWTQSVALGDTAVLYCSFDAILAQVGHGMIDWVRQPFNGTAKQVAHGNSVLIKDKRYRVYMPHRSALSVLIIRKTKRRDTGRYRCHLSKSTKRHRIITLDVTESKLDVVHSPTQVRTKPGEDVTLWCNATGLPQPMIYWKRVDRRGRRESNNNELWGSGLTLHKPQREDTGLYACYLDNYVQPVRSYQFNVLVEEKPWRLKAHKMRFDSTKWHDHTELEPKPLLGKSFLLMCETDGEPKPLPHLIWYRNGHRIRNRSNRRFYIIDDRPTWRPGYVSSTLVIMKFHAREKGEYICQASNMFGVKRKEFKLTEYATKVKTTTTTTTTTPAPPQTPKKATSDDEDYEEGSAKGVNRK